MRNINEQVGRLLGILHRGWRMHLVRELEPFGLGNGNALFFLAIMHHEGASQEELAAFLSMDKATVTRAMQRLERRKLIVRRRDPRDARRRRVFLSPAGAKLVPRIRALHRSLGNRLLGALSADEKKTFYLLLERLVTALEAQS